ncbi:MAG TPA: GNAT family N-acetyltransferase [Gammaproteobacteria bacterium]|nr:GNAT family N-acetyltransferase [Gammaproteobacteria bacterium]
MAEVHRQSDAVAFLDRAEAWLQEPDPSRNMILAIAYQLEGDSHFEPPFYLATVESAGEVCGCALRAGPDGMFLTALPVDSIPRIVDQARELYATLPEVIGPEVVASAFAQQWSGQRWRMHLRSRCYRLGSVDAPRRSSPGSLRKGTMQDLSWLRDWAREYARETGTRVDLERFFDSMLKRGLLDVWEDDGPRCVVTTSKLTPDGAWISSLYTPPAFRRNGYATAAVAAASRRILDSGRQFCFVGADEDAASTRGIYERIGYEPIGVVVVIHLD